MNRRARSRSDAAAFVLKRPSIDPQNRLRSASARPWPRVAAPPRARSMCAARQHLVAGEHVVRARRTAGDVDSAPARVRPSRRPVSAAAAPLERLQDARWVEGSRDTALRIYAPRPACAVRVSSAPNAAPAARALAPNRARAGRLRVHVRGHLRLRPAVPARRVRGPRGGFVRTRGARVVAERGDREHEPPIFELEASVSGVRERQAVYAATDSSVSPHDARRGGFEERGIEGWGRRRAASAGAGPTSISGAPPAQKGVHAWRKRRRSTHAQTPSKDSPNFAAGDRRAPRARSSTSRRRCACARARAPRPSQWRGSARRGARGAAVEVRRRPRRRAARSPSDMARAALPPPPLAAADGSRRAIRADRGSAQLQRSPRRHTRRSAIRTDSSSVRARRRVRVAAPPASVVARGVRAKTVRRRSGAPQRRGAGARLGAAATSRTSRGREGRWHPPARASRNIKRRAYRQASPRRRRLAGHRPRSPSPTASSLASRGRRRRRRRRA